MSWGINEEMPLASLVIVHYKCLVSYCQIRKFGRMNGVDFVK